MRADLILIAVAVLAALAASLDCVVTTPTTDPESRMRVAQNVGSLPRPAPNPRLGAPPSGGHLGEAGNAAVGGAVDAGPGSATVPADPAGRIGAMSADRLGAPPLGAVAPPPAGAVAPPAARAVQPPPGSAVAPATR